MFTPFLFSLDTLCTVYYLVITLTVTAFAFFPSLHDLLLHGKLLKPKHKLKSSSSTFSSTEGWFSSLLPRTHSPTPSKKKKKPRSKLMSKSASSSSSSSFSNSFPFSSTSSLKSSSFFSSWVQPFRSIYHHLKFMHVPKHWFSHFYLVATPWTFFLAWYTQRSELLFFGVHVLRRFLEQVWLFPKRRHSKMHLGHYFLGLSFYIVTPLAFTLPSSSSSSSSSSFFTSVPTSLIPSWCFLAWFVFTNVGQFYHHYQLAHTHTKAGMYILPTQGLFQYCICPHYFFEILLYFEFFFLSPSLAFFCCLGWVVISLSISAHFSYHYYEKNQLGFTHLAHSSSPPPLSKYLLVPFIY